MALSIDLSDRRALLTAVVGPPKANFTCMRQGVAPASYRFITLNTVGYGDIVPAPNSARMLAMLESTTGILYVAVLVWRRVALQTPQPGAPIGGEARS